MKFPLEEPGAWCLGVYNRLRVASLNNIDTGEAWVLKLCYLDSQ